MIMQNEVHWVNSVLKSCSVALMIAQNTVNVFLKFGVGRLLKLLIKLSDCAVWQKSFAEKSVIITSSEEVELLWKSEWS